jgi:hypothetical protein
VDRADVEVSAGRYSWAKRIFEAMLHFENCPDGFRQSVEQRLALLKKLETGENTDATLKEFMALHDNLFSLINLADIERVNATQVSDVRQLPWPPKKPPQ